MAVQVNYHMMMEPICRRMLIAIKDMREIYVPPILVAITDTRETLQSATTSYI